MATTSLERSRRRSAGARTRGSEPSGEGGEPKARGRLHAAHALGPAVRLATVQTKLAVGTPGDRYEREADHVAERVASGQAAPEISRIPAGGLKAQRQPEATEEAGAQTLALQRQAEGAGEPESEATGAQGRGDERGETAQRQEEPSKESESKAQAKCAACESEEKAQRQSEEPERESAQSAASSGEEMKAQRQPEEPKPQTAQTAAPGGEDMKVQRQEEGGGEEAEAEPEEEGEEREAAEGAAEEASAPECPEAEAGGAGPEAEGAAAAEGEEREEVEEGEERAEGGEGREGREAAAGELGCGAEGGEGEEAEAPAAGAGGQSCGAAPEAGAEGGPEGEAAAEAAPAGAPERAPTSTGGVPSCAEEVPAEREAPEEASAEGPAPAEGGAAAAEGECPSAQTKTDESASAEQSSTQMAAEEGEPGAQTARADEAKQPVQRQAENEESAQSRSKEEKAQAQGEESETAQTKEEEEPAAQTAEEETGEASAQHRDESSEETQARTEEPEAQTATEEGTEPAQTKEEEEPAAQRQDEAGAESAGGESEEASAQRREEKPEEEAQARAAAPRRGRLRTGVAARHMHARGAGEPLLPSVRDRLEATLGVDLEAVRVHADSNAQAASKALRAKAFTHRSHIFLGAGQSRHDVSLMAHEATHVLQQDGIVRRMPKTEPARPAAAGMTPASARVEESSPAARAPVPTATVGPPAGPGRPGPAAGETHAPAVAAPAPRREEAKRAEAQSVPRATTPAAPAPAAPASAVLTAPLARAAGVPAAPAPATPAATAGAAVTTEAAAAPGKKAAPPAEEKATDKEKPPETKEKAREEKAKAAARGMGAAPEAVPPAPEGDARFQGVMKRLHASATREKSHAPASTKAADARAAVVPPENERPSRAERQQVGVMETTTEEQSGRPPQTESFLAILEKKLEEIAPKNMEDTLDFKDSGKAGEIKAAVTGEVGRQKENTTGPVRAAAGAQPDVSAIPETRPTALAAEPEEAAPGALHAEEVLPQPKPPEEISAEDNKDKAEQLMAENDIDEEQLERANEPQFTQTLEAKRELDAHADKVPERYREQEQALLKEKTGEIVAEEKQTVAGIRTDRTRSKGSVRSRQEEAKKREEEERRKIAEDIRAIYRDTRKKVEDRLNGLDGTVATMFDHGERLARERFESHVDRRMRDYKRARYDEQFGGSLLWLKDKIFGMPEEVNEFYVEGRDQYVADMKEMLKGIAAHVDAELLAAKKDIAEGKREIAEYVSQLGPRLQGYGRQAQDAIAGDFDDLEGAVEDKKHTLADDLAQRYRESRQKLDERIEELKAENQGLLDKFVDFLKKVVEVLRKFKDLIVMLVKVGGEIVRGILKDPAGFLGNLLDAIKLGFNQFRARIGEYLQRALFEYISGSVRDIGISAPAEPSPGGVFGMVLQILGITVDKIRSRVVRLIGPRNVERIELAWKTVSGLLSGGAEGLWERAKAFVGDLKERVAKEVREWVIAQIVRRGIEFLLSLFNPVTALLRAIKMIYDLIMFFVENIDRITQLVNAVLQSVSKVAAGNVAAAANWIEGALARGLTVLIGFLARLLGLSGIADRIRAIIKRVQRPVERAIDAVLRAIVRGLKWGLGKLKGAARKGAAAVKRFLFPRRAFRAGARSHQLFFRGTGPQAALMIASDTKALAGFVAELRARPENRKGPNKSALDTVSAQIASIDRLRGQIDTQPDRARAGIDAALAVIADQLGKVLAAGDFATESNPLPLTYPKRASERYPSLYIGPRVGSGGPRIAQSALQEAESDPAKKRTIARQLGARARRSWEERGLAIERFEPHGKKALPEGGESIGLDPQWQTSPGKKLKLPPPRSTPGGGRINEALAPYGFSPKGEGLDGDHVTEIQLGGEDVIPNLWPLDKSENRAAGSILRSATFTKPDGATVSMAELKRRARTKSVWLVITSTK